MSYNFLVTKKVISLYIINDLKQMKRLLKKKKIRNKIKLIKYVLIRVLILLDAFDLQVPFFKYT